jgi:hypothetical protein
LFKYFFLSSKKFKRTHDIALYHVHSKSAEANLEKEKLLIEVLFVMESVGLTHEVASANWIWTLRSNKSWI